MKKIFITFIGIAILGLCACNNSNSDSADSTETVSTEIEASLVGAWRNVDEGANYIEFSDENKYIMDIINYRQEAGLWKISNDSLLVSYTSNGEIVTVIRYAISIEGDKLTLANKNSDPEVYTKCEFITLPLLSDKYDYVDMLVEGMAVVATNNNSLYGYINEMGEEVIAPMYSYADQFNDGEAMVELDGEILFIDKDNNMLD